MTKMRMNKVKGGSVLPALIFLFPLCCKGIEGIYEDAAKCVNGY